MNGTFGPGHRLHDNRDYSRVFNRQQKAAGRYVVVLVRPRDRKAGTAGRIGVMIAVKTAALAVRRHQLKRWVRELFRRQLKEVLAGHDTVVLFRRDPPADAHAELDREIIALIPKALAAKAQPAPGRDQRPAPASTTPR